jgi:hypothetical protein
MMGWLSSVGSIARMTIPVIASLCFSHIGANYLFLGVAAIVFVSSVANVVFYDTIVPKEEAELDPTSIN